MEGGVHVRPPPLRRPHPAARLWGEWVVREMGRWVRRVRPERTPGVRRGDGEEAGLEMEEGGAKWKKAALNGRRRR